MTVCAEIKHACKRGERERERERDDFLILEYLFPTVYFRYVKIDIPGRADYLTLCEVEIFEGMNNDIHFEGLVISLKLIYSTAITAVTAMNKRMVAATVFFASVFPCF